MAAQADITKFVSRNPEEAKKAVIRAVANTNRGKVCRTSKTYMEYMIFVSMEVVESYGV